MEIHRIVRVVKIRTKSLFSVMAFCIIIVMCINIAHAAGSKLIFSNADVKVGGKSSRDLINGDTIDRAAKPGDNVEFRIQVKNNYTSGENLDIRDIVVAVTIEGIDDGDDLDDESKGFDLRSGSDKRVTIKFQTPIEVEETSYNVKISAEGEDENGTNHIADMTLRLDVNKDSHLLDINKNSLAPQEVSCNRKGIKISTTIINIGNDDEKDIKLEISNTELGLGLKDSIDELLADPNQEESKFSKTYSFNIPDTIEAGSYPITISTLYNDGRKKTDDNAAVLTVSDCSKSGTAKEEKKTDELVQDGTNDEVSVITPQPKEEKSTESLVQPNIPPDTSISQEGVFKSDTFIIGVIIAEIVAVVIGIVLIIVLFRRRSME